MNIIIFSEPKLYSCSFCQKPSDTAWDLVQHVQTNHGRFRFHSCQAIFTEIIKWISSRHYLYILLSANIPQETIPDLYVIVWRYSNLLWEKDGSQHGHFLWAECEWSSLPSPSGGTWTSQEGRHSRSIFSWHSSGLWSAQPTRPLVVRNVLSASARDTWTI